MAGYFIKMRPLSEATARVAGKSFARKYIALGRIIAHWPQIIGEKFAEKAQPVKINYRKHKHAEKPVASLDIAVSGAEATLLHYQKGLILERINQIFGERWISAIRFVHSPANTKPPRAPKPEKPLTSVEKNNLTQTLEIIEDPVIKERLEILGEHIIKEERT